MGVQQIKHKQTPIQTHTHSFSPFTVIIALICYADKKKQAVVYDYNYFSTGINQYLSIILISREWKQHRKTITSIQQFGLIVIVIVLMC